MLYQKQKEEKKVNNIKYNVKKAFIENKVVVLFVLLCIAAIYASKNPLTFVANELFVRIGRNGFIVLSLLIPVLAGMGLNFGMTIGAVAAQIAVFWVVYWGFTGIEGFLLCVLLSTPLAIFFGYLVGTLFNKMKGSEMIAGMVLGFFVDGLYQLFFLFVIGGIIPVNNPTLIIAGGVGVKNTIDLAGNIKYSLDTVSMLTIVKLWFIISLVVFFIKMIISFIKKEKLSNKNMFMYMTFTTIVYGLSFIPVINSFLSVDRLLLLYAVIILVVVMIVLQIWQIINNRFIKKDSKFNIKKAFAFIIIAVLMYAATYLKPIEEILMFVNIPVTTYLLIALLCGFNTIIIRTRLGQNMRTVGQSRVVANAAGINVNKTRIIAMIISTVLACWGQLIYLQNIGTFSTYGAHTQVAQFAIAALLVGGASVQKASNKHAIMGVILFHTLFIVAPQAGKQLFNNAQLGEYFRVFVSYGVIAVSLAMHAWKTVVKPKPEQLNNTNIQGEIKPLNFQ